MDLLCILYVLQFDRTELAAMMQRIQVSSGVVPSPGLASEKGGLLGERCCSGLLSLLAGMNLMWKRCESKERTAHLR